jgi:ribokinase
MTLDLFTAGGATIDNIVAADGAVSRGVVGGNAVHSALGALLWGCKLGIAARVPANFPARALDELRTAGIDVSGIARERAAVERTEWFIHDAGGGRVDHLHASEAEADAFGLAAGRVEPGALRDWRARLAKQPPGGTSFAAFRAAHPVGVEHVPASYWSARGVHIGAGEPAAMIGLARAAKAKGLVVGCDPGPSAARFDAGGLAELLAAIDVFLPSEREVAALMPGRDFAAALGELARRGAVLVIGKRGAGGSIVVDRAGTTSAVPALPVAVRDPTGAGDAFCGGFLAAFVAAGDPVDAARHGTVSASFAIEAAGALTKGERAREAAKRLRRLRRG